MNKLAALWEGKEYGGQRVKSVLSQLLQVLHTLLCMPSHKDSTQYTRETIDCVETIELLRRIQWISLERVRIYHVHLEQWQVIMS